MEELMQPGINRTVLYATIGVIVLWGAKIISTFTCKIGLTVGVKLYGYVGRRWPQQVDTTIPQI